MGKVIDLSAKTFGRWKVIKFSHKVGKALYWKCICECGTERAVLGSSLTRADSVSCGCFMRERSAQLRRTHGYTYHPAYSSWRAMKSRCGNSNCEDAHLYKGRGITFCERWQSFQGFWQDMGPTWREGLSIERLDVDGNYEPSNCTWATPSEQALNRRTNIVINTPNGPMCVIKAARAYGFTPNTIYSRLRYGWNEEDLLLPVRRSPRQTQ